jgi:hypothetical protein
MSDHDRVAQTWMAQAMCQGYPTRWWFPERGQKVGEAENYKKAKTICNTCQVKTECRNYGDETRSYGMWGVVLMGVKFHNAKSTKMDLQNV